ncbi:MAG: hypothetical protein ACLRWM_07510 [Streptococcus sp.]
MKIEKIELNLHLKDSDQRLFEGWYFKIVDCKISLAIIVGISKTIENLVHLFKLWIHIQTKSDD